MLGSIAVVVMLGAAAAVVVGLRHKASVNPTSSPVGRAAEATVHLHTADVSFEVETSGGQAHSAHTAALALFGSGEVSFTSALGSVNMAERAGARSAANPGVAEQLILDKGTLYLDPGLVVGQLVRGKSWIAATADDLGSTGTGTISGFATPATVFEEMIGDPTTLLEELKGPGVAATSTGSAIYRGTPVQGYKVTLTQKKIDERLSRLPSSLRPAASGLHATEDVYVTTNGLVRAIVVPATIQVDGSTYSEDVVVAFSHWGGAMRIVTPTSSQVVSWAQLKSALLYTSHLR